MPSSSGTGESSMVALLPSGWRKRAWTLALVTGLYCLSRTSTRIGTLVSSLNTDLGMDATTWPGASLTRWRNICCQKVGWVLSAWSSHIFQRQRSEEHTSELQSLRHLVC